MEIVSDSTAQVREIQFTNDPKTGSVDAVVQEAPGAENSNERTFAVHVPNCAPGQFPDTLRQIADAYPGGQTEKQDAPNDITPKPSNTPEQPQNALPKDSSPSDTPVTSDKPSEQKSSENQPDSTDSSPTPSKRTRSKRATKKKEEGSLDPAKSDDKTQSGNGSLTLTSAKGSGAAPSPSEDNRKSVDPTPTPEGKERSRDTNSEEPKSSKTETETAGRKKTSTALPTPMPPAGLNAADLRQWFENNVQREPAPSPNGPLKQVEVISWMQVPQILKELESGNSRIRLNFPDIIPANPEMAAEQEEVREFLANHAGSELKDINAEVTAKIAGCVLFRTQPPAFTAKEYVQQFALDLNNADKLRVCDVVRVTDAFKPTQKGEANMRPENKKGRDIILSTIEEGLGKTNEFRSFVIEVTAQNKDIFRQQLRGRYDSLPEPKPDTTKTKIWVAESFSPGAAVEEYDFLAFIEEQGTGPTPAPRKEEEKEDDSGTPPVTKPTTSTKTENTDEDTPAPTPPQSRRDGKRSRGSLVLGASS